MSQRLTRHRFASLDGLRGVAALIVVLHHALLIVPVLTLPYFGDYSTVGGFSGLLLYSPLHLAWAGTEAVFVFFVLSGFVLSYAARDVVGFPWAAYYPSRFVRLYLPVIAAIVFAWITILLVPRVPGPASVWVTARPSDYTLVTALQDAVLVNGTTGTVTPLWSLQWEVLFSIVLPLTIVLARGRLLWLTITASLLVSTLGFYTGVLALAYIPMFVIGAAVAMRWPDVRRLGDRLSAARLGNLYWALLVVVALALMLSFWILAPALHSTTLSVATRPLIVLGATILVVAVALWAPLRSLFSIRPIQWLGRISFSLYLVHEPVVVAVAHLLDGSRWGIPISIAVSIVVAAGFYAVVERPSHRLAQRIKRAPSLNRAPDREEAVAS
jgi:peptidoglycan/LPS O-acetylase OafA/YrhL